MKVLIFGFGSIGKRHTRLLKESGRHQLFAFRSSDKGPVNDLGLQEIFTWNEVDSVKPEIAFITNPTNLHLRTALPCAERGMALFFEKPVDSTLRDLDNLLSVVKEKNLPTYVAYVLRFHPLIKILREILAKEKLLHARLSCTSYLPAWREGRDYKELYAVSRERGGGVLLDLSHEFDVLDYLFGPVKEISGNFGRVSDLTEDSEDFADVVVRCEKGPVNLHLDYFSPHSERRIQMVTDQGYYQADLLTGSLHFETRGRSWEKQSDCDRDTWYREQLQFFFDNLDNPRMMNNLFEAAPLFRKIIEFREKGRS